MIMQAHMHSLTEVDCMLGSCWAKRIAGICLIVIGIIMMICFMPYWLWLSLLGVVLIGAGCLVLARRS